MYCHARTCFGSVKILCSTTCFASTEANFLRTNIEMKVYSEKKQTLHADLMKFENVIEYAFMSEELMEKVNLCGL